MLSAVDAGIVLAFLVYCVVSGLRARRVSSQDLEQYFLAGRTLPGWKAGCSMAATQFAADTPLLVTGMIATAGVFSLWRLWIYALAFLLLGFVLGSAWRRAGVLTDAELAELRYGTRLAIVLRAAKAIYFGTIFNCTVMAMVLFAATRIAEPFLHWDQWLSPGAFAAVVAFVEWANLSLSQVTEPQLWAQHSANNLLSLLAVVSVTALYSTTGGLRAVVNTDVVQLVVAMVATAVYAVVVVGLVGGLAAIPERLTELYGSNWTAGALAFTPTEAHGAGWAVLGTMAIQWIAQMNADGTGYLAQRAMACQSDRDVREAVLVFVLAQVLLRSLLWIPIALGLLILFPMSSGIPDGAAIAAREATFVEGIDLYLPVGIRGLMLTGMLAALASTLDTHLNWGASYWTNDIYRRLVCDLWRKKEPDGRSLVWVARASNLLILAVSIAVLTQLQSIQEAWKATLLLGAGMGGPLVMRWLWWRVTAASELAAIAVSSVLAPVLMWGVEGEGVRILLMTTIATSVTIVTAMMTKEPAEQLREFYRRVRPPGFWGPIAYECGGDPGDSVARLRQGLRVTAGLAFCVFSLLVATGTWLFGSPAPAWFPWRGPWIAVLIIVSAALLVRLWPDVKARAA
jgi:Na+/proline symporter